MQITERRTHTRTYEHILETKCDLCKEKIVEPSQCDFEERDIKVFMKIGYDYPEMSYGTRWEYDVCEACMRSRILPLFEAAGCDTSGEEYSY